MYLFADDVALFSYTSNGLQRQLDIPQAFCAERGLKVDVQKTKTIVFEHHNPQTQTLTPAIGHLCKSRHESHVCFTAPVLAAASP